MTEPLPTTTHTAHRPRHAPQGRSSSTWRLLRALRLLPVMLDLEFSGMLLLSTPPPRQPDPVRTACPPEPGPGGEAGAPNVSDSGRPVQPCAQPSELLSAAPLAPEPRTPSSGSPSATREGLLHLATGNLRRATADARSTGSSHAGTPVGNAVSTLLRWFGNDAATDSSRAGSNTSCSSHGHILSSSCGGASAFTSGGCSEAELAVLRATAAAQVHKSHSPGGRGWRPMSPASVLRMRLAAALRLIEERDAELKQLRSDMADMREAYRRALEHVAEGGPAAAQAGERSCQVQAPGAAKPAAEGSGSRASWGLGGGEEGRAVTAWEEGVELMAAEGMACEVVLFRSAAA